MHIHESHVLEILFGISKGCKRCHMCECHSMHKLIVECERIDGRVKTASDDE